MCETNLNLTTYPLYSLQSKKNASITSLWRKPHVSLSLTWIILATNALSVIPIWSSHTSQTFQHLPTCFLVFLAYSTTPLASQDAVFRHHSLSLVRSFTRKSAANWKPGSITTHTDEHLSFVFALSAIWWDSCTQGEFVGLDTRVTERVTWLVCWKIPKETNIGGVVLSFPRSYASFKALETKDPSDDIQVGRPMRLMFWPNMEE